MLIQVRVVNPHLRKHPITGSGRRMYVADDDGWLRAVRDGQFIAPEPGVHPDCAARFRQISDYKVEPPPKQQVEPPPKAPSAPVRTLPPLPPPPTATARIAPPPDGHPDPEPSRSATTLPTGLPPDDAWSISEWLTNAHELGISLSDADKRLRPKAKLVERIRERANAGARES